MQRHTSYLLVILKHERPFKDLPDMVADRLSKMEGVDGSGVTVATFDAVAGKDFIVRAEALEDARYSGDAVRTCEVPDTCPDKGQWSKPMNYGGYHDLADQYKNIGGYTPASAHPTAEERAVLSAAIKQSTVVNVTTRHWTAEELDALARKLTKGIGDESNMVQVFRGLRETVWMDKHDRADMSAEEREYARRVFEKKTR